MQRFLYIGGNLLAVLVSFSIAIYIYFSDKKNKVNTWFILLNFFIGFWCLAGSITNILPEYKHILTLHRIFYTGGILLVSAFINLAHSVRNKEEPYFLKMSIRIITIILLISLPTKLFIKNLIYIKGTDALQSNPGFIYYLFIIYLTFGCIYALYILYQGIQIFKGTLKTQIKYIFLAYSIALAGGGLYFSTILKIINLFSPAGFLVTIGCFTLFYAVIKYNIIKTFQQIQAQLIQSEKLAGVGQLAAGVAHEINNPMGFIINNLEILKNYSTNIFNTINQYEKLFKSLSKKETKKFKEYQDQWHQIKKKNNVDYIKNDILSLINENLSGAERITKIVADLKNFSNPVNDELVFIDVNNEIKKAISLLSYKLKNNCYIKKKFSKLPHIHSHTNQLQQVFFNLFLNAIESIKNKKGRIEITTLLSKKNILIKLSDNGEGIPEKVKKKIFDPFFTTKEVGKGSGLGLSIAYGIIKKHKGTIEVKSTPRKGTTFTIKLPVKFCKAETSSQ